MLDAGCWMLKKCMSFFDTYQDKFFLTLNALRTTILKSEHRSIFQYLQINMFSVIIPSKSSGRKYSMGYTLFEYIVEKL